MRELLDDVILLAPFPRMFSSISPSAFSEIRLHPVAACRAWTAESGCWDAVAWDEHRELLPFWRRSIEGMRLRISDHLAVQGVDPLGIFRALLIHESTASVARSWLRAVGFVHLEAASGIHLYCAWNAIAAFLRRFEFRGTVSRVILSGLRSFLPPALWLLVWSLTGFRPGLLRPILLVGFRQIAERRGYRWARALPILAALGVDALLGFLFAYGNRSSFTDWAPGELHYALSWWGGILAAELARDRGWGSISSHAALSVGSWLAVLPMDLYEGRFSPFTPVLSFVTVELLARGGYVLLLGSAVSVGVGLIPEWPILEWESAIANRVVGWVAEGVSRVGGAREF